MDPSLLRQIIIREYSVLRFDAIHRILSGEKIDKDMIDIPPSEYIRNVLLEMNQMNHVTNQLGAESFTCPLWRERTLVSVLEILCPVFFKDEHVACIRKLIEHGCDVNIESLELNVDDDNLHSTVDRRAHSCLKFAIDKWGNYDTQIIRLFLDNGAKMFPTMQDDSGLALGYAIDLEKQNAVFALMDRGYELRKVPSLVLPWPDWLDVFMGDRDERRKACVVLTGIGKHRLYTCVPLIGINVMRLIGQHVWSGRLPENETWNVKRKERRMKKIESIH